MISIDTATADADSVLATNASAPGAWLMLAVGDDRQHGGNDGYDDEPDTHYAWDSTVSNHTGPSRGDAIVLWDKHSLIGASVIEEIEERLGVTKLIHKCPICGKAGIKARRTISPRYKCYKCKALFEEPASTPALVTTYRSTHDVGWIDLSGVLTGGELRSLCVHPSSQHSIRPLRWDAFLGAVQSSPLAQPLTSLTLRGRQLAGGGHKEALVRLRVGQASFRSRLLEELGATCAFTGPAPASALEACHLYSYAAIGEHHDHGGLLLRRDIHRLFDLGELAVDPISLTIDVRQSLADYPAYTPLDGKRLSAPVTPARRQWLTSHWREHRPGGG